jgi:hypothetical protein
MSSKSNTGLGAPNSTPPTSVHATPAAHAVKFASLASAAASYRSQTQTAMQTGLIGIGTSTVVALGASYAGLTCGSGTLLGAAAIWTFYGVGIAMLGKVERLLCPHCKTFLPSTQPWTCRTCRATHEPPRGPSLFDGCSKCSGRPSTYQCPQCSNFISLTDTFAPDLQDCAVAAGYTLKSAIEQQTEEIQKHTTNHRAKATYFETEIDVRKRKKELEDVIRLDEEGPRAAAAAAQTVKLEAAQGTRESNIAHYEARRRAIEENDSLNLEQKQRELRALRKEEKHTWANTNT